MTQKTKKAFVALLLAVALVSFGCAGSGGGGSDDADTTTEETVPTSEEITSTTGEPAEDPVVTQSIMQPPIDVDILFVLDASGSLRGELAELTMVLQQFVGELSNTPSFTVAFTLGFISEDPLPGVHDGSGRLYSVAPHPPVLSSNTMTNDEIIAAVTDTLTSTTPVEAISDGGEAGLYSLHKLLTTYQDDARALGFLRPDTALVVIFLSDENDICSLPPNGIPPVPDPDGQEEPTRQTYCGAITPSAVLEVAESATDGAPVQFSGLIYTGPDVPPVGENEIGYGYLETISLSEGVAADLANPDFGEAARNLGNTINALAASLQRRFVLTQEPVNPLSIEVLVDGEAVNFEFIPEDNAVLLAYAGHPGSQIEISYRILTE